jgi:predicted O-methyltransferase YrrM
LTKNQRTLLNKVDKFHKWLINNDALQTNIIEIDDGLAIIKPKLIV